MKITARARAALNSLEGAVQYRFAAGGLTEAVSLNLALISKVVGRTLASELTAFPVPLSLIFGDSGLGSKRRFDWQGDKKYKDRNNPTEYKVMPLAGSISVSILSGNEWTL